MAIIAVCGPGAPDAGSGALADAEAAGRVIGGAGATLVCGGLGGVMEAACRGARDGGGTSIGILPGSDRDAANAYVDVAVATGMGEGRNVLVVRSADALVAVGGEFGTLSEVALALQAGIPVIGLGTWELAKGGRPVHGIVTASNPEQAADLAVREAARRRGGR
jgi:uncharacterized protein (TIGR00725 family)